MRRGTPSKAGAFTFSSTTLQVQKNVKQMKQKQRKEGGQDVFLIKSHGSFTLLSFNVTLKSSSVNGV